ncbi:ABC transporter substrate-binding protein [Nocardiopsis mangrovi]|uniref:ABC transporter substrate-binding protein n=1 Tax=Nocardiopsis mangrovi TaxID=1179818 RepID=A0ABV9DSC7_9ACTN
MTVTVFESTASRAAPALAAALLLSLTACTPDDGERRADVLTFWTPHVTPDRLAQQEETAARFTEETGIEVDVVPMEAADQGPALEVGAEAGDVPDVVLATAEQAAAWMRPGLLDPAAAGAVLDELGPETFNERALEMVTAGDDGPVAVPSDGWGQVLVYRTDMFEAAGVRPPGAAATTTEIADAAERIDTDGVTGIALGTRPGDPFTTQTLEALLLARDCPLVGRDGAVALDARGCVGALGDYQRMAAVSAGAEQDARTARDAYLAGESAMLLGGPDIVDELADLVPGSPTTCDECADDPAFLAENSGFTAVIGGSEERGAAAGPEGAGGSEGTEGAAGAESPEGTEDAQGADGPGAAPGARYGQTLNLGVPRGADTADARAFIEFLLGDGYLESLAVSPEGRVPMRAGTPREPAAFAEGWSELRTGEAAGTRVPLTDLYDEAAVRGLADGAQSIDRWGFGTEHAVFAGTLAVRDTLSREVGPLIDGADPAEVASAMADAAREVQADLD